MIRNERDTSFKVWEDDNHNTSTLAQDFLQVELAMNVYNVCVKYIVVCKIINM